MWKLGNLRSAAVGTAVVVALLVCVAQALASVDVAWASSKRAKRPYLFMTVSHGKVTKVRWEVYYTCPGAQDFGYQPGAIVLNARIKNGRFSRSVTYQIGSSNLGNDYATTSVRGTIVGNTATVRLSDDQSYTSYSPCYGKHSFTLHKTRTGWVSVSPQSGRG